MKTIHDPDLYRAFLSEGSKVDPTGRHILEVLCPNCGIGHLVLDFIARPTDVRGRSILYCTNCHLFVDSFGELPDGAVPVDGEALSFARLDELTRLFV